jgi:predicted dehydrogenase
VRVAFTGVGHWHASLYARPVAESRGHHVVAMSDPALAVAQLASDEFGGRPYTDVESMLDQERPDFVFILGVHDAMPTAVRACIERGIPCAVEKPAGATTSDVLMLAKAAAAREAFVAVSFVLRDGRFYERLGELFADRSDYVAFRFIGGSAQRYLASGVPWVMQRERAGGGALLNLGVHFLDLIVSLRLLGTGSSAEIEVVGATMLQRSGIGDVEDFATIVLEGPTGFATLEVGYLGAAGHGEFDLRYRFRSDSISATVSTNDALELVFSAGGGSVERMPTINVPLYETFVMDVLMRAESGAPPRANLTDLLEVRSLVERCYSLARWGLQRSPATP